MAPKRSAGLLVYRHVAGTVEVLIGHMGGPYWARKDAHAWSIPKGEYDDDDALGAARREFAEEIGHPPPRGELVDLGSITQQNGKQVRVWAVEGDLDPTTTISNLFSMEWPHGSGRFEEFPEIDRTAWFDLATAATKLVASQSEFLDRLAASLGTG
jgi:predicted NUDIX family NTP pyrophosphohydrolase